MKPLWVWVVCLLATWGAVNGVAPPDHAPSPSLDCTNGPLGLLGECLTFVENGSMVSKPEGSCCAGLKMVLKDSVLCLCEAFKAGSGDFSIALNFTKVLSLPSACGISTPPFSKCALVALAPYPSQSSVPPPSESVAPASPRVVTVSVSPSPSSPARPPISGASTFPFSILILLVCLSAATWTHL